MFKLFAIVLLLVAGWWVWDLNQKDDKITKNLTGVSTQDILNRAIDPNYEKDKQKAEAAAAASKAAASAPVGSPVGQPAIVQKPVESNLDVVTGPDGKQVAVIRPDGPPAKPGFIERKSPARVAEPAEEAPTWGNYTMTHRKLPEGDLLERWRVFGVEAVADPEGRVVSYRGDYAGTTAFRAALVALDTVPGSCCLQVYTVYVDRRAAKGFDLAAALGAAAGVDTELRLGAGGLVLDVGADRIAAALSVLADGSAVDLVQSPYVRLTDRVEAKVESIQEVPIPETALANNGIAQTSVKYRKVGLQLSVSPEFNGQRLRMKVEQQNGVIGTSVKIGENEVPVIQSQLVSSAAEMDVGQTLVLGGVRTVRKTTKRGILSNAEETVEGALYVVMSTYSDEPRAVEVEQWDQEYPVDLGAPLPPLAVPSETGGAWIMGELLPPKWEAEEREFLRGKGGK